MAWSKAQLVGDVFAEIALAGHVFDTEPEEQQQAARRLEMMLANWEGRGITLGFSFASDHSAIDLSVDSGLPLAAIETVVINAAKRIAASFGKSLTPQQLQDAHDSFKVLQRAAAFPTEVQMPAVMPRGAGVKPWRVSRPFVNVPDTTPLSIGDGGDLDILKG